MPFARGRIFRQGAKKSYRTGARNSGRSGDRTRAAREKSGGRRNGAVSRPRASANAGDGGKSQARKRGEVRSKSGDSARRAATLGEGRTRAQAATAGNDIGHQESAREHPPAARLSGGGASQNGGRERQRPVQAGIARPFNSGPDSFRAAALPLVSETGGDAVNYRFIIGSMLERVKHYPKTARQRGAKGAAIIGFVLDELGRIASVSMLRSSGDADLDAESVALVNRAAPFPPPPPGAQVSFAIEVAFGMGS